MDSTGTMRMCQPEGQIGCCQLRTESDYDSKHMAPLKLFGCSQTEQRVQIVAKSGQTRLTTSSRPSLHGVTEWSIARARKFLLLVQLAMSGKQIAYPRYDATIGPPTRWSMRTISPKKRKVGE